MTKSLNSLNHRLVDTVRRELGPEYIRLFAPHFISHGIPAGITGMILSGVAAMYLLYGILYLVGFADRLDVVSNYFYILLSTAALVIFSYTFPFQDMVMGKKNHLAYFKKYGLAGTAITIPGIFIFEPAIPTETWLDKGFPVLPALIGSIFCLLIHSKKFAAMLAYQQKLWAIKARLIAEEKALVAELKRRQPRKKK